MGRRGYRIENSLRLLQVDLDARLRGMGDGNEGSEPRAVGCGLRAAANGSVGEETRPLSQKGRQDPAKQGTPRSTLTFSCSSCQPGRDCQGRVGRK